MNALNALNLKIVYNEFTGRWYVQRTDERGEIWDMDPEGFATFEEAEEFVKEAEAQAS